MSFLWHWEAAWVISTPGSNPLSAAQLGDPAQILPVLRKIQLNDNVLQSQKIEEAGRRYLSFFGKKNGRKKKPCSKDSEF